MLLRRFSKHVTDQNWFAVGLDVLVVIIGVYIGIYIGDIANEKATHQDIIRKLDIVKMQLKTDLKNIDRIAIYREEKLQQPQKGLEALSKLPTEKQIISESLSSSFSQVYTFFPKISGYSNIKDTGYLDKIDDPELIHVLADLYDSVYVRHTVNADESDKQTFEHNLQIVMIYWDRVNNDFIGDHTVAIPRLRNALLAAKLYGEHYVRFLNESIRPKVAKAINAIENYNQDTN